MRLEPAGVRLIQRVGHRANPLLEWIASDEDDPELAAEAATCTVGSRLVFSWTLRLAHLDSSRSGKGKQAVEKIVRFHGG